MLISKSFAGITILCQKRVSGCNKFNIRGQCGVPLHSTRTEQNTRTMRGPLAQHTHRAEYEDSAETPCTAHAQSRIRGQCVDPLHSTRTEQNTRTVRGPLAQHTHREEYEDSAWTPCTVHAQSIIRGQWVPAWTPCKLPSTRTEQNQCRRSTNGKHL